MQANGGAQDEIFEASLLLRQKPTGDVTEGLSSVLYSQWFKPKLLHTDLSFNTTAVAMLLPAKLATSTLAEGLFIALPGLQG